MGPEITMLGGGELPPGLKEMLEGKLGGGKTPQFQPARMDQIRYLLEEQKPFSIGDIVQLKPAMKDSYKWPKADDKCIVTQILREPYRHGDTGTSQPSKPKDFALAFVDPEDGYVHEYLHDSREFVKVGSIYDPVTLPSGDALPVQ